MRNNYLIPTTNMDTGLNHIFANGFQELLCKNTDWANLGFNLKFRDTYRRDIGMFERDFPREVNDFFNPARCEKEYLREILDNRHGSIKEIVFFDIASPKFFNYYKLDNKWKH